ncbi:MULTISPECIES: serine hydrolase domain-containing protein [Alteromonas]|jgi:CubicO group peptidase (beta-lactamase class C family)|uniref:Serine hydrolase n=1 Tax=Alteromonas stellipolaris TaxID=233316 RepID=A0AAW7Z0K0_9ALTE|nr:MULTISPECIES: serine hydrolase domain-containing protein [Alteromonas]AMJ90173.1 serine hydrolase [Alteromonas sp. Mac2]ALM90838.1 Beta-lactamase class C family protein [Alteromonas stellipolaris LMG 21856]AMJ73885.1 serine hydrolase [Alteromonas stellipolaris]AMJ86314.1 serine hydrolase [Alteromonas sp. Mac1]AMJ94018.1 serine hydrolase [Alteromonas stellipolaris]
MVRNLVLIFLLFFASYSLAFDSEDMGEDKSASLAMIGDNIAMQYQQMGWFSGGLLITKDNEVVFASSYGFQNTEERIKNSTQSRFNLGSIMKDFTKVLILQQVEAGKLKLSDKLVAFELGFKQPDADKITIEHLLNHSAGFADIFVAEYRQNQLAFDTLDKKIKILIESPLLFTPGTDRKYSNYGYVVLGVILEKVTGKSFEALLKNNIFNRVEMTSTTFRPVNSHEYQSIRYTYQHNGKLRKVGVTEHPSPDGGIESTVVDVQRFYRALFYSNKLLKNSDAINRQLFAMDDSHWGAYGGGQGVSAAVEVDLDTGYEIVVLANTDHLVAERISGRIYSYIKNGEYQPIRQLEKNFAFEYYQSKGKQQFYKHFKQVYNDSGYSRFIGRIINEAGMELLNTKSWTEAFDMFEYLVSLFPNAPQAYDSLAFAYLSKGDREAAKSTFSKSLTIDASFKSDYVSDNYGHNNTLK